MEEESKKKKKKVFSASPGMLGGCIMIGAWVTGAMSAHTKVSILSFLITTVIVSFFCLILFTSGSVIETMIREKAKPIEKVEVFLGGAAVTGFFIFGLFFMR